MTIVLGTIAIVAAVIVVGVIVDRKIGILPRPNELANYKVDVVRKKAEPAGETAATAIRATAERLANLRASRRCVACRAAMTVENEDRVRYDERELLVLRFRCTKCSETRSLYVDPS